MKLSTKICVITLSYTFFNIYGQAFEYSGDCQDTKNVHCSDAQTSYFIKDNIRATFLYSNQSSGGCSGTMINQFYDAGGRLRQYFI